MKMIGAFLLIASTVVDGSPETNTDAAKPFPPVMFPADPSSGATCDFSKCAFSTAFVAAEKAGTDEMVAACKKIVGMKGDDPCLKDCKVKMQKDTITDLAKANVSACADELMEIIQMTEDGDGGDDYSDGDGDGGEDDPDFSCLVGCKGQLKGKSTDIKEKTLEGLTCKEWAPLLFSLKGNKCTSKCTEPTKLAVGNSTKDGSKECAEQAKQEKEQQKEEKAEEAAMPHWDCLEGCDGASGKPMKQKDIDALNCTGFDTFVVGTRKQKSCTKKCTKGTIAIIANLTVGDTCEMQAEEDSYYGDGGDGDSDDGGGVQLNVTCLSSCSLPGKGKGKVTPASLQALSCQDFIAFAKSVGSKMPGKKCLATCDVNTVGQLADMATQDPKKDCAGAPPTHVSEIKQSAKSETSSSLDASHSLFTLALVAGAVIGVLGTVTFQSVIKRRVDSDGVLDEQEMNPSLPEGLAHL